VPSQAKESTKNLPESIRQRLKNLAIQRKRPVDEVLRYYAIERFLYRLGVSSHMNKLFLKGGLMLRVWDSQDHRATMDIDLLARTSNQHENVRAIVKDIANISVEDDAIIFNTDSLLLKETQAGTEYRGLSARFTAHLTKTRIPVQIDIGFSDVIVPKAQRISYPTLIPMPAPQLMGYTAETVVAEKLESIVKLGQFNTRMKDFFDLWTILCRDKLPVEYLKQAIEEVFAHRGTALEYPDAFTESFATDPLNKQRWRTFLKSMGKEGPELDEVISTLGKRLAPFIGA